MHYIYLRIVNDLSVIAGSFGSLAKPCLDDILRSRKTLGVDITDRDDVSKPGKLFADAVPAIRDEYTFVPADATADNADPRALVRTFESKSASDGSRAR